MFGPIFQREAIVAPRQLGFYAAPAVFVSALFALAVASWQLLVGAQRVENLGDLAWFGAAVYRILAPLQLGVAISFAALLVASAVALEKDRKTLELLLMSRLTNVELVLGKLFASLLIVLVVLLANLPQLLILSLLGGVSVAQILLSQGITLTAAVAAGSVGALCALWREKTFQAVAMSILIIVLWFAIWEVVALREQGGTFLGAPAATWAIVMSPWRAIQEAARPRFEGVQTLAGMDSAMLNIVASCVLAVAVNALSVARIRAWNLAREARPGRADDEAPASNGTFLESRPAQVHSAGGRLRPVWNNPILWREVRTQSFGKRIWYIRAAYLVVALLCATALVTADQSATDIGGASALAAEIAPMAALMVVGLLLMNALSVTSLTNERDSKSLDLLLVTDLSAREIVLGKLGGAFYNTKEMVLLPMALCAYLLFTGRLDFENFTFTVVAWCVMCAFAAMLGLHAGISYANSRTATATSLGTLLFLFLGTATCMRIMLAFRTAFEYQFGAFIGFIAGGSIGMYVALNWRYRSKAINLVALVTPFATFFVVTSYLMGNYGAVFLVTSATYGFAIAAMLVPAVTVFDVAIGSSSGQED